MLMILLTTVFVIVCLLLILMVVINPYHEGGLASAFGGMGSDSFFGTRAHQHVNRFTLFLAVLFLVLAVVLGKMGAPSLEPKTEKSSIIEEAPKPAEAPAPPAAPAESPK